MGQRIRTALIAIPIALLLIKLGGLFFSLGTLLLAAVAYKEYRDMIHAAGYDLYGKAAFLGIVLLVAAASLVFLDSSLSHALLVPVTILFFPFCSCWMVCFIMGRASFLKKLL